MTSPAEAAADTPADTVPGVAEALERVRDLSALPVTEHVARFDALHEVLTGALADIDEV